VHRLVALRHEQSIVSMLQRVAYCSVFQGLRPVHRLVALRYEQGILIVLQLLQCVAACCSLLQRLLHCVGACCSVF